MYATQCACLERMVVHAPTIDARAARSRVDEAAGTVDGGRLAAPLAPSRQNTSRLAIDRSRTAQRDDRTIVLESCRASSMRRREDTHRSLLVAQPATPGKHFASDAIGLQWVRGRAGEPGRVRKNHRSRTPCRCAAAGSLRRAGRRLRYVRAIEPLPRACCHAAASTSVSSTVCVALSTYADATRRRRDHRHSEQTAKQTSSVGRYWHGRFRRSSHAHGAYSDAEARMGEHRDSDPSFPRHVPQPRFDDMRRPHRGDSVAGKGDGRRLDARRPVRHDAEARALLGGRI